MEAYAETEGRYEFGSVTLIVQDGQVIQVEENRKSRLT
ncbi:DUF2292 domain-containing protein [Bacillus pumilus]